MGIQPDLVFWRIQYGHPVPLFLAKTKAFHSCPFLHCQHTFLWAPGRISSGVNFPFSTGCHCSANFGFNTFRFLSLEANLPAQYGQPLPLDLTAITLFHSWPFLHNHQTFLADFGVTFLGLKFWFFVECHWLDKFGCISCRLYSSEANFLAQ